MADAWRDAQRRYASNPGDDNARQALIRARERAGLPVGHLLERLVLPGRELAAKLKLRVSVEGVDGSVLELGDVARGRSVRLPPHRRFWVRPTPTKVTDELLDELREQALPGLSLERARIKDDDLAALDELPALRWLSLRSCGGISGDGVAALVARLPALEALDLSGCKGIEPESLPALADAPALTELALENHSWSDDALAHLAGLTRLRRLSLRSSQELKGDGLAALGALSGLVWLDLGRCLKLSGKRFLSLPAFPELEELRIDRSWNLTDPALPALNALPRLTQLSIGTNKFSVNGLRGCARLQQLQVFRVNEVTNYRQPNLDPKQFRKLTDELFNWLVELPVLETVIFEHLSRWITDAGLSELARCPRLGELWISDCLGLTPAGVRALAERCPALVVHYAGDEVFDLGVEGVAVPESGIDEQVVDQLLSVMRLRDMKRVAKELGLPAGHRTKAAAREALGGASLEQLLPHAARDDLSKLCRRLKLEFQWHDGEEVLREQILAACQRAAHG